MAEVTSMRGQLERRESDLLRRVLSSQLPYTTELLTADQKLAYSDVIAALHRLVVSLLC